MKKLIRKFKETHLSLIFVILKFRNPGRSAFHHSLFYVPPENFQFKKFQNFLISKISQFPK